MRQCLVCHHPLDQMTVINGMRQCPCGATYTESCLVEPVLIDGEPVRVPDPNTSRTSFKVVAMPPPKPVEPTEPPWTPEKILEDFLADLRAGKVKPTNLMMFWLEREPNGNLRPHTWYANVDTTERIAFHQFGIHLAIEEWRN